MHSSFGQLPAPHTRCYHGGAFFQAVGDDFATLERSRTVINADVLDAWFPPSPVAVAAVRRHLPWLLRTSPPTGCEGLTRAIAGARRVDPLHVLPAGGSSTLIFLALRQWLTRRSRVLVLDPTYGEYAHVFHNVVGCRVERLPLARENGYAVDPDRLLSALRRQHDLVVIVNPNNPTGAHMAREVLEDLLTRVPARTKVWVDEAYVDYVGPNQSLERFATRTDNVVVCKSMSKVYALSGARVAYLCGAARLIAELRPLLPPWAVSLPGQVAAVAALRDPMYYARRYRETHRLRERLAEMLRDAGAGDVLPSVANWILCHLAPDGPTAADVVRRCQQQGVFLRDVGPTGSRLGAHALRVAVKDEPTNARIAEVVAWALGGGAGWARGAPENGSGGQRSA
ncbi:MAG: histidinol-phosphate aminotransferase family protein [Gemmatimonadota bacterium]|nr:histidinol-phosphate aminotransferase family protein [Gemmatimonadota bacterium]